MSKMVEPKKLKPKPKWPIHIIANIIYMFSPKESIVQLKLWNVNKNFYRATKEVIPYQLKNSYARIEELQDEAKMV